MAGLVPAIQVLLQKKKGVDARHNAGHDKRLNTELVGEFAQIPSRRINGHRRLRFAGAGTVLVRSRNVAGAQSTRGGGRKIAAMRRHHHALCRFKIERLASGDINARLRFVIAGDFRAEDCVPGKIIAASEIDHQ